MKNFTYLFLFFLFLIGCATKPQIKTFYNCAFSPNLDYSKNYRTIVLPVTTEVVQNIDSNLINVLYNFTSLKLLRIGKFSLIERMKVEKLIKEQDFGISGKIDIKTAAKIGKILGAEIVVLTEIDELKPVPLLDNQYDSLVYIRLIDSTTGEILYYAEGDAGPFTIGTIDSLKCSIAKALEPLFYRYGIEFYHGSLNK
ncbi:MAG: CsgG/HfaB family protein [Elusimicrobiota bacterium]